MTVFVCVDDNGGMMFNHRRQSRDRILIADLIRTKTGRLCMESESEILFQKSDAEYTVCGDVLNQTGHGNSCFVENKSIAAHCNQISTLVIYRWNRVYPADFHLDVEPKENLFQLQSCTEFEGSSHEKITKEVWKNESF